MCYMTDFLVCINIALRNNSCRPREFSVNFSNSFREFSVKFGTFLKLYREIAHFFPWIRLVPTDRHLEWRRSLTRTTSRVRLRSSTAVDGKDVRLTTNISSLNPVQRDILPHCHSQLSDLTIRLYTATSLKSISKKRWLYHQMFKWSSDQFNSLDVNHMTSHSYSHWSIAFSWHILLQWP